MIELKSGSICNRFGIRTNKTVLISRTDPICLGSNVKIEHFTNVIEYGKFMAMVSFLLRKIAYKRMVIIS